MSTQTAPGQSFPTPCKRCGGALYRHVDYCPYCGAVHPLDTTPHSHTAVPGNRTSAASPAAPGLAADVALPEEVDPTAFAEHHAQAHRAEVPLRTSLVSAAMPAPQFEEPPNGKGGNRVTVRRVLLAIFAVVVIGLAYVAYALFSDNGDPDDNGGVDQSASTTNQDARTSTGTIAPFTAAQTAQTAHPVGTLKPTGQDTSITTANSAKPTPSLPATPATSAPALAPPVVIVPPQPAAPQFHDASQALQAARLAFNANDLSTAQAAVASAQVLQPGNPDAQTMASELRPLTARRDSALQAAQTCVSQQSWGCARQHANEALAIDTGNETAKAILQRVIRETGWAPRKADASPGAAAQVNPSAPPPAATAPLANTTGTTATAGNDASSIDARERSIVDSGWSHARGNSEKPATATSPSQ